MMNAALVLFSSALFYFSLPNIIATRGAFPLACFFCVPLLGALSGRSLQARFWLGLGWGLLAYGVLVSWLIPVSFAGWALFTLALSLQAVLFALLLVVPAGKPGALSFLYIPTLWVLSEYARSLLLGGFTWAVGYSQAVSPLMIQGASLGGAWVVSWVVLAVNSGLWMAWEARARPRAAAGWAMAAAVVLVCNALLGAVFLLSPDKAQGPGIRIAAVQPNISRADKVDAAKYDDNMDQHLIWSKKSVVAFRPELMVWPETAFPDDVRTDRRWYPRMSTFAANMKASILVGSALLEEGYDINAALLVTAQGEWVGRYDKMRLVPFSEAVANDPLSRQVARWSGGPGYHFRPGTRSPVMALRPGVLFGVAICSEEFYPALFRRISQEGAQFAVVMLNDSWFTQSEALALHGQAGVMRAVETGSPLVRAANTGWTVAFDGRGRSIGQAPEWQRAGFGLFTVTPRTSTAPYVKFGDIFPMLCAGFVIIVLAGHCLQRFRTR
jgi:apolipoprotein N-acyltransferase